MTESEAKERVCPYRFGLDDPACIASQCMAWNWIGDMPPASIVTLSVPAEQIVARNLVQTSMFPKPPGKGWEASGEPEPPKTKETSQFTQAWTRDESHAWAERHGDCGLKRG